MLTESHKSVKLRIHEIFTKPHLLKDTRRKYNDLFGKKNSPLFVHDLKYLEYGQLEALNEVVLPFLIKSKTSNFIGDESVNYLFDEFYNKKSDSITDLTFDFIRGVLKTSNHTDINDHLQNLFKQWSRVCTAVDVAKSIKRKDVLASNHVFTADDGSLLVVGEKKDMEYKYKKDAVLIDFGDNKFKADITIDQAMPQDGTIPLSASDILKKDFSLPILFFDEYFNFMGTGNPKKPIVFYASEFSKDKTNSPINYIVLKGAPDNMLLMDKGFIIGNSCFSYLTNNCTTRLFMRGIEVKTLKFKKRITTNEKLFSINIQKYPAVPSQPYPLTQFI